ncbi:hypothetical protein S7S_05810 [Isoalcanivorax pacificus W11-5]|uniref:CBS domain-containing protein n=1 Tax=Isoalcanivorax pacificus W11-5 TaxID=391936 RepID=A0A0B4XLL4_9GAMM|nr:CBS domain-containing protein [Isoalcanivorax pacificus]AJD47580.1 hypothetical protein S7S_05810 [Isoalcanivorax pacificus W11-5]
MKRIPSIGTLMTPFPWHLDISATVQAARALMLRHGIHHLPVTDPDHHVLGLLSLGAIPDTPEPVADWLMPVPRLDVHTRADEVLEMMAETHQSIVVLCHHDRLAGIFTWTDACNAFAARLREPFLPSGGDDAA